MDARWTFYGRQEELGALLERMRAGRWFFGAIRGRRRIGKTALIQQALDTLKADGPDGRRALLVQLPDSSPADVAAVFRNAVRETGLDAQIRAADAIRGLPDVAAAIGSLCAAGTVVVLDEFQLCHQGPLRGLPSLLQMQVDRLRDRNTPGGLVLLGSVQTEMEALLDDRRAPLFGRTTFDLTLGPWDLRTVFEVCGDHGAAAPERALTLWTLFGGVPKYWRHFAETTGLDAITVWEPWARQVCEQLFLRADSPLREEGDGLLGRELHRNYLAVLRVVAERKSCTHRELRDALPELTSAGPYLKALAQDLRLIERQLPVFAHERQRRARYVVADPFLCAWLSALQPACQAARIEPSGRVAERLLRRLMTLEGHAFERMVREASEEASRAGSADFPMTDRARGYWNRPNRTPGAVEIDFIAWNDQDRTVRFGSCKRSAGKHDAAALLAFRGHVDRFLSTREGSRFREWRRELALFSPRFPAERRAGLQAGGWTCRDISDFRRMLLRHDEGANGVLAASPKVAGTE